MTVKEATARIKINKLLEVSGWRFFAEGKSPANIQLEPSVTIKTQEFKPDGAFAPFVTFQLATDNTKR